MIATSVEIVPSISMTLLRMEGVVVVGVVPVDRIGRYETFLVGGSRVGQRLDHRLLHRPVVEVEPAVLCDDVLAAIGDQELVELIDSIDSGRAQREADRVEIAHTHGTQRLLQALEEIIAGIPGFRDIVYLVAGLLDQWPPNMIKQSGLKIRHTIKTPL